MRTQLSIKRSCEGGMLLITLVVCVVVGVMLTAYLSMVSGRHGFTQRSQVWNNCIPMCEAGVEDALAHLNHSNTKSNFAINGWVKYGTFYRKDPVSLNGGTYYVSFNTNWPPVIMSTGRVDFPLTGTPMYRAVRVQTKINQQFPNVFLAKAGVSLNGNGRVDSFNSTNALESTNGQYSLALATDRAMVATTSRTAGDMNVGNVSIYGSVGTGPGGTVTVLNQGNVGSEAFNDNAANNGRIEDGHKTDDVNVYIADVTFPSPWGPFMPYPPLGSYLHTNGVFYQYVLSGGTTTPQDYECATMVNLVGQKLLVRGKVRLHVRGNTTVGAGASIELEPGASIEWYARGGTVTFGGEGIINGAGFAKNFSLFGLNTCTIVTYNGSAKFVGTIYAPYAAVSLGGTTDGYGAVVGRTITMGGTMSFHYDEALKGDPKEGKFLAASWREMPTN